MPRFKAGDKAVLKGMNVEIRSWPETDDGPFAWVQKVGEQEVQGISWVSNTPIEAGQLEIHSVLAADALVAGVTDAPQPVVAITQGITINDSGEVSVAGPDEKE